MVYNLAHAQPSPGDDVRNFGPSTGPVAAWILNGRGRAYHARGAGAFSLKWMAQGRARYELERRAITVSTQTAVLVDQDQPYEMEFEARSEAESFCLFFDRGLVAEAWASAEAGLGEAEAAGTLRPFPNVAFEPSAPLAAVLAALRNEGPVTDAALIESRLLLALGEAVSTAHRHRRLAIRTPAAKPSTRAHLVSRIEAARRRMKQADGVGCDLESLAREAGLSRFHFLRLFKAMHGVTPLAYAERLRVRAAEARLHSGGRSVGEVAAALGYESPSAFARAFRRWTGVAPATWRN